MKYLILLTLILSLPSVSIAQQSQKITPQYFQLRDNVYMLKIGFTNIGILVDDKGLLLVDASTKQFMDTVYTALTEKFDNRPVKYVLNTHSHGDHTGGNPLLMNMGSICIAHQNAKNEMFQKYYTDAKGNEVDSTKGKPTRDYQENELPAITFEDKMYLDFGGENIELVHITNAHTEGDAIIYFKKNNVIALGDNYFGNAYTFGKNIDGMIGVYETVLAMINTKTIILPGHGVPSNKEELQLYTDMVKDVKMKVDRAKQNGKTLDEVKADKSITEKYDEKYGRGGTGAWTN